MRNLLLFVQSSVNQFILGLLAELLQIFVFLVASTQLHPSFEDRNLQTKDFSKSQMEENIAGVICHCKGS